MNIWCPQMRLGAMAAYAIDLRHQMCPARAPAGLPARARGPLRRPSRVGRNARTPSPHDGDSCAHAACGRPATRPGRRRRHTGAAVGARPSGSHLRGTARPCGHAVPGPPAPGLTTPQKALHASARDPPRVQHARQDDRQRLTARALQRFTGVEDARVHRARTRRYGRAPAGPGWWGACPRTTAPR